MLLPTIPENNSIAETILIRVDASFELGMGHLSRCIAFSKYVKKCNLQTVFITCEPWVEEILGKSENCIVVPKDIDLIIETIDVIKSKYNVSCILVDINYSNNEKEREAYYRFLRKIQQIGLFLASIEVPERDIFPADLIVIPYLGAEHIKFSQPIDDRFLLGSKYFLLKEDFKIYSRVTKQIKGVDSLLVTMGGSDPEKITLKVLKALQCSVQSVHINVLLGLINDIDSVQIENVLDKYDGPWEIHKNVENVATLMSEVDLAICNSGLTKYELASLGVPAIVISNKAEDARFSDEFSAFGSSIHLGYHADLTINKIGSEINRIIVDKNLRKRMSDLGVKLVDGKGIERIYSQIMLQTKRLKSDYIS